MHCFKRIISLLLACAVLAAAVPAYAAEVTDPSETTVQTEAPAATQETTGAAEETTVPTTAAEPAETTQPTEVSEPTEPTETLPEPTEEPEQPTEEPEIPEETVDPAAMTSQSSSMSFGTSGEETIKHTVPLYLQTDYPYVPYSGGSVATSGCTMTAIAMVASYLTGEEHLPDSLARRFNNYESSNIQRMEAASTVLDLTYEKTTSWSEVVEALEEGKVVIALMGKTSKFTSTQHTIVLTGITEDGKILVNDPYGPNYKKYELIKGFNEGFPQEMITKGFGGAWIYDFYDPPEPAESRYPDMHLTDEEKYMIASVIWLEARGESFEGQQAIAEIIFNRMASGDFCETIEGTICAEGQFRTAKFLDDAKPGELQYKAMEKALTGPYVLPMDVFFFGRQATNKNVWGKIGGHIFCYAW